MKFAFTRTTLYVLLLGSVVIDGVVFFTVHRLHEPVLRVTFFDVGQGDAILIQSPTGNEVLIDGGPDRSVVRRLGETLAPLDRTIAMVLATHEDKDHVFGLVPVFENYTIGTFLSSGNETDTVPAKALHAAVSQEKNMMRTRVKRGMRFGLGGGAFMEVLYPFQSEKEIAGMETNDTSVVVRVVYGATSFLLGGDLPSPYEDQLVALGAGALTSTVLKAGHHGSKYSTDALWLAAVRPETVVISAGKNNAYGHPSPLVLERVARSGARVVSTAEEGTITFTSDGLRVQTKVAQKK